MHAYLEQMADTASLELAGVNFRLRMATDSALALLPSSIQRDFDAENNSYRISAGGDQIGVLFIRDGRIHAVRRFANGSQSADFFALQEALQVQANGPCYAQASKNVWDIRGEEGTYFDFKSECNLYTFVLRAEKKSNTWGAFVDLVMPYEAKE